MSVGAIALVMMLEAASLESVPASSVALPSRVIPQSTGSPATEEQLVRDIIVRSYPNLRDTDIRLKTFRSNSDYFRTSFSLARFFIGASMQYFILVNPEWTTRGAPIEGVRSILAHELAHIDDFTHGKRIRLFRLVGLLLKGTAARFERRADLQAIARDYGAGLEVYRRWLYDHVPPGKLAEKRRNYFSPQEIDAILAATARRPDLFGYWMRHVPASLADIQSVR